MSETETLFATVRAGLGDRADWSLSGDAQWAIEASAEALDALRARLAAVEAERGESREKSHRIERQRANLVVDLLAAEARVEALTKAITHVIRDSPGTPDSVKTFLSRALSSLPSGPLTPEPEQEGQ